MSTYQFLHLVMLMCNTSDFIAPCIDSAVRCGEDYRTRLGLNQDVRKCFTLKQNGDLPSGKVPGSTSKKKDSKI